MLTSDFATTFSEKLKEKKNALTDCQKWADNVVVFSPMPNRFYRLRF